MKNRIDIGSVISLADPKSPVTEAFRTLRTNIQFTGMERELKTLLITSAQPKEGKTITAANLAVVMAQAEQKVLLIDGDLRKPSLNLLFRTPNEVGLTDLLFNKVKIKHTLKNVGNNNLFLITTGRMSPNPAELLGSERMSELLEELKQEFDIILFDTPPLLPVTDGQLLSRRVDGVLLVVSSGKTSCEQAVKAKGLIEHVGGHIAGVVLNNKKVKHNRHYYKNGNYGSHR